MTMHDRQTELSELEARIQNLEEELSAAQVAANEKPAEVEDTHVEISVPLALLSALTSIRELYISADAKLAATDIPALHEDTNAIKKKLFEFDTDYAQSLLSVDLHRRLDELSTRANAALASEWERSVVFKADSLYINASNANVEFAASSQPMLREKSVREFEPFITKLSRDLTVTGLEAHENTLKWRKADVKSIDELFGNLETFLQFLGTHCPPSLLQAINKRFGNAFVVQITREALPGLFMLGEKPSAEHVSQLISGLQTALVENKWQKSSELTQFANNFDSIYADFRRSSYLSDLREMLREVTPVTESKRIKLIKKKLGEESEEEEKDDWDWNEDEEEEEEEEKDDEATAEQSKYQGDYGSIVALWETYSSELTAQKTGDPFITLYRALVPQAYNNNHLWIYADTKALCTHVGENELGDELVLFAHKHLQQFVEVWQNKLDKEILPPLFGKQQQQQVKSLMKHIDEIAVATNEAGGVELRQSVLSRLVEQCAVFVIDVIEQVSDIGDDESKQYASLISKLSPLALYFTDVNLLVPSWNKLEVLKQILTSNLATIREMHRQHMLLDFSYDELKNLICALFVDSPVRRDTLDALTNTI